MRMKWSIGFLSVSLSFVITGIAAAQTLKVPYVSTSGFRATLYLGERAGSSKRGLAICPAAR
jgi:hypothetical protein